MKIAMIASESDPFVKTGGLADVVGSLPGALKELGHKVIVILPYYRSLKKEKKIKPYFESMGVWMGGDKEEWCAVRKTVSNGIDHYFIEFDGYFDREGIYSSPDNSDYHDNALRYCFFSRAALQLLRDMNFRPDVVHAHDWQTAPAMAYMKTWDWGDSGIGQAKAVLTIHNIGYQGVYPAVDYNYMGFGWENFTSGIFEDHSRVNLLKGGIHFADYITTVSPTYADEISSGKQAYGMAPYLKERGDHFVGVLNGVDYEKWNPDTDEVIPANYSESNIKAKQKNKKVLKEKMGLDMDDNFPIVGVVSRFADQKGLDVLACSIESIVKTMSVHFVILGSGDPHLEKYFGELPSKLPGKVGTYIGYNNELAHLIEAGSDFFIMPSRYEPCGLNQIYSLKYGTIPIVRDTGGLSDTIEQYDEKTGKGTGFKFNDLTPNSIYDTVGWAVSTYFDRKPHILKMKKAGMKKDFSWKHSAKQYEKIYKS